MTAVGGQHERGRTAARLSVDVSAGGQEQIGHRRGALPSREQQRGKAAEVLDDPLIEGSPVLRVRIHEPWTDRRARLDVHIRVYQHLNDIVMSLGRRPHQRGLATRTLAEIDIGAGLDQMTHSLNRTRPRRGHDGCLSQWKREIRVGA